MEFVCQFVKVFVMRSNTIYSDARNYAGGVSATLTAFIAILTSVPQPVLVRTTFLMLGSNTTNLVCRSWGSLQRNHIKSPLYTAPGGSCCIPFCGGGMWDMFFHDFAYPVKDFNIFFVWQTKHVLLIFVTTKNLCSLRKGFFLLKNGDDFVRCFKASFPLA